MPPARKRGQLPPEAVAALIAATQRQNLVPEDDELLGGNEGERRANSSIFGDLFDVLSRPARASAGAAFAATDNDPNTDVISGLLQGLSGKSDKSYSDVIKNVAPGLPGPARAIAGFAGDVLLDPLTYVGVKNVKGTSVAKGRVQAVKKLSEAGEEVNDFTVENLARRLAMEDPSHSYVQFAGKKISPDFKQPSAIGNALKDKVLGDEGERKLAAKLYSRQAELPFGLADTSRVYEAHNAGYFEKHNKHLGELFGRLDSGQSRQVMLGLEKGLNLSDFKLTPADKAFGPGLVTLEDYKKVAQKELKRYFDEEMKLGLYKPEQYNPNYVLKYFRKGVPETKPGLPAGARTRRGDRVSTAQNMKEVFDLEGAEQAGLDPLLDVGEMMQMRAAKHYRTVGRQAFVRKAIEEFGVDATKANQAFLNQGGEKKWQKASIGLNAAVKDADDLKDKYLPHSILKALNQTEEVLKDGQIGGEFVRWFDKTMNVWKKFNTSYNPGYHIRNSMSDGIINYMDGVTNPSLYERSFRTLRSVGKAEAEDILEGVPSPVGKDFGIVNVGKHNKLTPLQLWDLYLRGGSKAGYITSEISPSFNPDMAEGLAKHLDKGKKKLGGAAQAFDDTISGWSDKREDAFRLAHHIKAMEDNLPKNRQATPAELERATLEAGKRVRKFNIDYGQLSTFERNTMRRIFPFYGWMRRNLPLQVELLFTKPGYMATYPKGQDLLQGLLGADNGEGDWMVPKWIRDLAPTRLALADNEKNTALGKFIKKISGAGEGEGVFLNLASTMTPIGDLETILGPVARGIETGSPMEAVKGAFHKGVNMATPVIKAPYELATGNSTFTGRPIEETGGWANWLASQLGPSRTAANVLSGRPHSAVSFLAGIGPQPVTSERQAGEFRRREDVLQARVNQEQAAGMARLGIEDPTNDMLNKYKNLDIAKMQRYMKNTRRIIEGMNGVQ